MSIKLRYGALFFDTFGMLGFMTIIIILCLVRYFYCYCYKCKVRIFFCLFVSFPIA